MKEKNVQNIAIAITVIVFIITFEVGGQKIQEKANKLYNADQDRILECGITHDPEYCHLLINGYCE